LVPDDHLLSCIAALCDEKDGKYGSKRVSINREVIILSLLNALKKFHHNNEYYMTNPQQEFKPYILPENTSVKEFTLRAVILGALFGILFGAATVYLALKAGLTVSASIPIAVLAISVGRRLLGTTILENNIIQTAGSAGESVAAGVVFTLPAFLFLSDGIGKGFFNYWTILMLAIFGGILGVLMMIPLRKSLIVKEHENLPYPEGTACAHVLVAGEKGGDFAKPAFIGLGVARSRPNTLGWVISSGRVLRGYW
jgi:uncharacterized oligopeptide transporter (OPT) family protein